MHDRKNRRIEIIIEGKDYDKFESFEDDHGRKNTVRGGTVCDVFGHI